MKKALINQIIKAIAESKNQSNFACRCSWPCLAANRASKISK